MRRLRGINSNDGAADLRHMAAQFRAVMEDYGARVQAVCCTAMSRQGSA